MPHFKEKIAIIADSGSTKVAEEIYKVLSKKIGKEERHEFNEKDLYINRFKNGEIEIKILENMRNKKVFLIKSFNVIKKRWKKKPGKLEYNPDKGYMELFLINDALKRTNAAEIINVLPHMPYQRQDKKDEPRVPISAKAVANLIETSGATRILTVDPHVKQIQGFYEIGFDDLKTSVMFAEYFEKNLPNLKDAVVVSPDMGGNHRAKDFADTLHLPIVVVYKKRPKPGEAEVMGILKGDTTLKGKTVIMYDDIIDSGGSILKGVNKLREEGVKKIYACCSHPVLSGEAKDELLKENIEVITTDTIHIENLQKYSNIKITSLSYLLAEAMYSIYSGKSISQSLYSYEEFKKEKQKNGF